MKKCLLFVTCVVVVFFLFNVLVYERRIQGKNMIIINKLTNSARYVPIKNSYRYTNNKYDSHKGIYAQTIEEQKRVCGEICNEKFDLDKCMECTNKVEINISK